MNANIQLIIPMSGSGKRFKDAGYPLPKPLIEVDCLPIIQHVVNLFPGVEDVIFICNKDDIKNTNMKSILEGICPKAKIIEIDVHKYGPVYAVLQAIDSIDDTKEIIVSYCDYGTQWDFNRFLLETRGGNFDGAIACYKGFHPHMLGSDYYAFCKEENNVLLEIREKQSFTDNRMSEFASNGTYYFKTGAILKKYFQELIDLKIDFNGEYYVSLVYNLLVRDGLRTSIFEIDKMLQWGTPHDLEIYQGWSNYFMIDRYKRNMTLILSMAGKGERFVKEGFDKPKPLIPVDGKPMFVRAVECLPTHKRSIFVCLHEHAADEAIKTYYPDAEIYPVKNITEGYACTCEIGINRGGVNEDDPILISACDSSASYDEEYFDDMTYNSDVVVWTFRNSQASKINPQMYSWIEVDRRGFATRVHCKQIPSGDPLKTHAIIGTMYFKKAKYFSDGLRKNRETDYRTNGEFCADSVLNRCIEAGLKVRVFEVDHYVCWGTPDDYRTYNYWKDYFDNRI